jgi:hypothetical protein
MPSSVAAVGRAEAILLAPRVSEENRLYRRL